MIKKPLGDRPRNGASWDEVQGFLARKNYYILIHTAKERQLSTGILDIPML